MVFLKYTSLRVFINLELIKSKRAPELNFVSYNFVSYSECKIQLHFFYIYRVCINLASLVKSVSDKLYSPSAAFLSVRTLLGGISEEPPACKNYSD